MSALDWLIVLLLNGSIIAYGLYLAWGTESSSDWFLAGRVLPWWAVGLSMFATNVDNADLVSVTGQTFNQGLHVLTVHALGSAVGGILAAFWIVPAIAKYGFYTNAEYLEARFGPAARVLSALIQIQYRTSMLGLMIWGAYLVLTSLVELPPTGAWGLIIVLVVFSGIYTAWGGLKSVVWTDAAQSLVMMASSLVIFFTVLNAVGGWSGLKESLALADQTQGPATEYLSHQDLLHISSYRGEHDQTSPYWIVIGWMIIGGGYWTVNHTQTMRLMGSRSLRDMKLAALFGVSLSLPMMILSACLGVLGRVAPGLPEFSTVDELYPLMANTYLPAGFKGIVVAGLAAAVVSTFDSMGSALSAIFTRDVYARFIVRTGSDKHYVFVGRLATGGVLLIGFLYLPFIWKQEHMLNALLTLIPVFVTPLFTVYVAGVFTRAHRKSGLVGLVCGSAYGMLALCDRQFFDITWLPAWLTSQWLAYSWSILFTAAPMLVTTLVLGAESRESAMLELNEQGWLGRSREELPPLADEIIDAVTPRWLNPNWLAVLLLAITSWVTFGLFW